MQKSQHIDLKSAANLVGSHGQKVAERPLHSIVNNH